ncbi:zinc finger, CCHC-type containing protein [Tanacetum coccineum]
MAGNTVKEMTTNFGKLDKFEGHDFRRWQKKMHFLLTTLKVVYVLTTPMPELMEDSTVEAIRIRAKWENDDYICRGHILNGMSDSLFDVYTNVESAKELWDSLESKYMAEDSSSKKFLVSNFNNYKMVDSRPVMEQYNELLRILGQYTQHGLKMDESISVSSIIDKLPPSWKDFKHTLKRKDDLSLVQLEGLKIKENKQNKGKKCGFKEHSSGSGSNKKPKLECWKCGKTGHFKRDFRSGNKKNANAGGSGKRSFNVQVDAIAWWTDSGATTHVCKDHCWFKTYEPVEDGSVLYMGDDHFAPVHGKGSVVLEFSSGKSITLFNVLYVLKLRKNLISGPVLNKPKDIIPNSDESQRDDHSDDVPSEIPEPRKGKRVRKLNIMVLKSNDDEDWFIMENNTRVSIDLPPELQTFKLQMNLQRDELSMEQLTSSRLDSVSDASWINNVEDLSSTCGWVFLLVGGSISWASRSKMHHWF